MGGLVTVISLALATHAVSVDQYPLRRGCDADEPVVVRLRLGDPVEVQFALVGSVGSCYKVVVRSGGKRLQGYVSADGITGTRQFDRARRAASQASVPVRREGTAGESSPTARRPSIGRVPAPSFSARTFSGSQLSLAGWRGKPVLVHFWATWCGPCRKQMPVLARIHRETAGQGVAMVGINRDADQATAEAYVAEHEYRWPMIFDAGGKLGRRFGVGGIPAVYIIDQGGKIVAQATGNGKNSERRIRAGLREIGVALP